MFNQNSEETKIYQDIAEKYDQIFQLLEKVNQGYLREHGQINPEEHDKGFEDEHDQRYSDKRGQRYLKEPDQRYKKGTWQNISSGTNISSFSFTYFHMNDSIHAQLSMLCLIIVDDARIIYKSTR